MHVVHSLMPYRHGLPTSPPAPRGEPRIGVPVAGRIAAIALTAVLLPGCASGGVETDSEQTVPEPPHGVSGVLVIGTGARISERDTVVIKLVERSTQDVVTTRRLQGPAGPSIPFVLRYEPRDITADKIYVIEARVVEGNRMKYTAAQDVAVVTRDHPQRVTIEMQPVP